MIYIALNAMAIGVAALAGLVIGAVWLRSGNSGLPSLKAGAASFVALFWSASILAGALILAPSEAGEWTMAIGSAVVIWAGFVLPALGLTLAVQGFSMRQIVSICAYWLLTMVAQAVIMQAWGLVPPPA